MDKDRQTDRQTDRRTDVELCLYRLCIDVINKLNNAYEIT